MRYRHLGASGLEVSEIGLGANSFGEPNRQNEAESAAIVHAALDHGINFVDTSNVYASGRSEEYIGRALRGRRHEMLIGTKFGSKRLDGPNRYGGSRQFVLDSIEASLRRLKTDYIDLYMIHRPDPRMPLEETLRALDDLVHAGKVRYIGCCNFEAWRMVDGIGIAEESSLTKFVSSQFEYSLLNRSSEREMVPACQRFGIGVVPYLPLAAGLLTGKVDRRSGPPSGSRLSMDRNAAGRWLNEDHVAAAERVRDFALELGRTPVTLALGWLLTNRQVSTVIAGATSPAQVAQNAAASEVTLTPEERSRLESLVGDLPFGPGKSYFSVAGYFSAPTRPRTD